ncbi:ABC transporter permease [candidate division KSB1 bacterium]|nr:ABC transporter permease [candidate division KSB1 bacterium]
MFKNHIKTAIRNIKKYRSYSIINIIGLAIGMTCFLLIALYIQWELSFDKYHQNGKDIYRIVLNPGSFAYQNKDGFNCTPAALIPVLKQECPEIVNGTRIEKNSCLIHINENSYNEDRFFYADPDFLKMFSLPLVAGNKETVLQNPYSVILTESMARKYFGRSNPIGQTISVDQQDNYLVTGIIKDTPANSHFIFDFVASFNTLYSKRKNIESWNNNNYPAYVQLNKNSNPADVDGNLDEIIKKYKGENNYTKFRLESMYNIHLHGHRNFELSNNSDIRYIYLFAMIGFFILLIACFNYINITTAQSTKRAKEVGLKKVIGANRGQLIGQFLSESVLFSTAGFILAVLLAESILPLFRRTMNVDIEISFFSEINLLLSLFAILLLVGCITGAFPAFMISSFQPTHILKKIAKKNSNSFFNFRNMLVIIQFVISAILIVSTITVYKQLQYIKNKRLGYKKDHIITLTLRDDQLEKNYHCFMNELSSHHRIADISASYALPHSIRSSTDADWFGRDNDKNFPVYYAKIDRHFVNLYEIELKAGTVPQNETSSYTDFILNEKAVKVLRWKDPVGKNFGCNMISKENGRIVAVVKDFHYYPLHYEIAPLVLQLGVENNNPNPWENLYFSIKINSQDIAGTLAFIKNKWKQFSQYPFEYKFVDSSLDAMYKTEHKLGSLFNIFAAVAVCIACLGLYGQILFSAEQKTKEIGIRKVLGATVQSVIFLVSKEFILLIFAANIIALPVAWYAMNKWLQNFAYRINNSWWIFAMAGGIALVIALLTVSWQVIRAATANPVKSLRYE